MATLANLARQGAAYREQKWRELQDITRPGTSGTAAGFREGWGAYGDRPAGALSQMQGGLGLRFGETPNYAQLDQFMGNTPAAQKAVRQDISLRAPSVPGVTPTGMVNQRPGAPSETTEQQDMLAMLAQEFQTAREEANAANEARYGEGKGLLSELGQRNQERVANWGTAASADIDERLQEQLGNNRAMLASRGLLNSTIEPAFAARAARDTAREQQRVSEMRDSRLAQYDTQDTNNLAGWIERRNDVAPSLESLAQLAMQYGASGDGEGMASLQGENDLLRQQLEQRYQPQVQAPVIGFSPYQAAQFQGAVNNAYGGQVIGPQLYNYGSRGSNAWPEQREFDPNNPATKRRRAQEQVPSIGRKTRKFV
jgi:hypothetical protein